MDNSIKINIDFKRYGKGLLENYRGLCKTNIELTNFINNDLTFYAIPYKSKNNDDPMCDILMVNDSILCGDFESFDSIFRLNKTKPNDDELIDDCDRPILSMFDVELDRLKLCDYLKTSKDNDAKNYFDVVRIFATEKDNPTELIYFSRIKTDPFYFGVDSMIKKTSIRYAIYGKSDEDVIPVRQASLKILRDRGIEPGTVVKHFKRETVDVEFLADNPNYHLYKFCGLVTHAGTQEQFVEYMSLFNDENFAFKFIQPFEDFNAKVDEIKYPHIKQEYIFEPF